MYSVDQPKGAGTPIPGKLAVVMAEGVTEAQVDEIARRHGATVAEWMPSLATACFRVPEGREQEFIAQLQQEPLVVSAEPELTMVLMGS